MKNTRIYQFIRLGVLASLYRIPPFRAYAYARLPRHRAGYEEYWVNTRSRNYRSRTLKQDQDVSLMRQYPTPEELLKILLAHAPSTVLEVGCGYGRNLEVLASHFEVQGIDISEESLHAVRSDLKEQVSLLDIVRPDAGWVDDQTGNWDVVFCWCVMMYFIDNRSETLAAMKNMEALAKKKVIVWEWRHVCDYMRSVYPSEKFEYHYIPVTAAVSARD